MNPRIGIRFEYKNEEGIILQSCAKLPNHYKRNNEQGPFFGICYENKYVWYNDLEIKKLLMEAVS